jgi:hypothetical protein
MKDDVAKVLKAKVETSPIKGGVHYVVERGDCKASFDVYGKHVEWLYIESPGNEGWLKDAHVLVVEVFRKHGIRRVTARAGSKKAEEKLKSLGNWKGDRDLEWKL